MPWIPTKRLISPFFEIAYSEQRAPDDRYTTGYRVRRYVANTRIAVSNGFWSATPFVVTFWSEDAKSYLELSTTGALAGHASDMFRMLDHPAIKLPNLGVATAGDAFLALRGWFELYTTERLQASAWIDYSEKPMVEQSETEWVRHLDLVEAPMPRPDLEFDDFSGRPSVKWRTAEAASAGSPSEPRPGWLPARIASFAQRVDVDWSRPVGSASSDVSLVLHAAPQIDRWKSVTLEAPGGSRIGSELRTWQLFRHATGVYRVADIPVNAALVVRHASSIGLAADIGFGVETTRIAIPTPDDLRGATITFSWEQD
jgi:hypothetical protein